MDYPPLPPPTGPGILPLKLLNWSVWGVLFACVAVLVFSVGKFAWEKWKRVESPAPKMLIGSFVGAIVSGSGIAILNAL